MTRRRQQSGKGAFRRAAGFTLVELIAVLVLIGILSAVAATRLMERSPFDAVAFNDQVTGLLRYAQKVAVAQNRNVFVRVNANGVALCYNAACTAGNRVQAPGGANSNSATTRAACADSAWACEAPPSQVTIAPGALFYFDPIGKPFAATDAASTTLSTFAPVTFSIQAGASVRSVTVERETGYVH